MESFIHFTFNLLFKAGIRYFEVKECQKDLEKTVGPLEKNPVLHLAMIQELCDRWAEQDRRESIKHDEYVKEMREKQQEEDRIRRENEEEWEKYIFRQRHSL